MKKNKVKGFTLMELIVVMAIFMIVLVAAMSFLQPVQKMVIQADVRESGAAQVNSISNYLQTELGSAEYLMVTNNIIRDGAGHVQDSFCRNMVADYVKRYYEGALKKGATTAAPVYGKGQVHVLTIDNTRGGEITKRVYEVSFAPDAPVGTLVSNNASVINKAYYQDTNYIIELGGSMLAQDIENSTNMTAFLNSITASDTTFNITAAIVKGTANPKVYEFTTTATIPLVNIMERPGPVTGKYYVIKESGDATATPSTYQAEIVDLGVDTGIVGKASDPTHTLSRNLGSTAVMSSIYCKPESGHAVNGSSSQYTFVYSYGNEMLTNY